MKKAFGKITNSIMGVSILLIIIALLLIIYPGLSLKTLGLISAIYMIIHGILLISLEFGLIRIFVPFENMLMGVLSIVLGLVIIMRPESASILIAISFGVWIIVSSINNIKCALFFRKINNFPYIELLVINILDIILGLLVIFNPITASVTLTLYLGIILLIHSFIVLADMIILKKNVQDKEKSIKEKFEKILPKFD